MKCYVDREFYTIISIEVLSSISKAVNILDSHMVQIKDDKVADEIIDTKINILKNMVLWYIESQRTVLKELRKLRIPN